MNLVSTIWNDLKRGENIDAYVVIVVAITLATLTIIEITPSKWTAPITVAVLALLAITTLGNRYRLEKILEKSYKHPTDGLFLEDYPETYKDDLRNSKEVWFVGVNLNRTIALNFSYLKENLLKGCRVRILVVDPKGEANNLAGFRLADFLKPDEHRNLIESTLNNTRKLKVFGGSNLEVKVINYVMSFGATAINVNSATGIIYLEHYGFQMSRDLPKLVLKPKDGRWYDYFKDQITVLWKKGVSVE